MALTQLTCLTSVQVFYKGGYQQCGSCTHWSGERLAEQAAVWAKLPVTGLGLYEGSGPYEGGVFEPLGRQLQQLRCLSVRWDWYDEHVGSEWAEHTPGDQIRSDLAACADSVLKVMHAFASLPRLQQLSWLCDEERGLCLSLAGLRNVLQQLGHRGQSSDGRLSVDELARMVELHM
ncbi:hypothetical protein OEZ85_002216 [Tetradesmus obliquus]|uniref:EF-hand domain-containing protein n=1 Tax=Tetradesmus obliquus TaxID=3088 RepID=A0ABY8U3A0_TETOB|nr:hypothetical protein OEZ85_002216 [Tetradesmus obliquus]